MEAAKTLLEKVLKIIISIIILMGVISSVLFMITHIKMFPINVSYTQEFILFLFISIAYLISDKFNFKYFKNIAAIALVINIFNLIGFRILIKLFTRG